MKHMDEVQVTPYRCSKHPELPVERVVHNKPVHHLHLIPDPVQDEWVASDVKCFGELTVAIPNEVRVVLPSLEDDSRLALGEIREAIRNEVDPAPGISTLEFLRTAEGYLGRHLDEGEGEE